MFALKGKSLVLSSPTNESGKSGYGYRKNMKKSCWVLLGAIGATATQFLHPSAGFRRLPIQGAAARQAEAMATTGGGCTITS